MPRLSTEEPQEEVEESAPPVIAFAQLGTSEDTTIIASTAPLFVEARHSLTPEIATPTAKPIAATNNAIFAQQSKLGVKIAARIAENNVGQHWRARALMLLSIALIGGANWAYLRQEPNIAQPEIELLAPKAQQTAGTTDIAPTAPTPSPETEDVLRAPVTEMAPHSPDVFQQSKQIAQFWIQWVSCWLQNHKKWQVQSIQRQLRLPQHLIQKMPRARP